MKKKFLAIVGVIAMLGLTVLPMNASAAMKEVNKADGTMYGTIRVMESDGWETNSDGGKYINQTYYVSKVNSAGYVYIKLTESYNVEIANQMASSSFDIISQTESNDGIIYLLKLKSGTSINTETELFTVVANIKDPTDTKCSLTYSPLSMSCIVIDNKYYDADGKEISQEEYAAACEGVTPPKEEEIEPPATGSYVPYVAVGGGLAAIVVVYLYSKKSNKMYKL